MSRFVLNQFGSWLVHNLSMFGHAEQISENSSIRLKSSKLLPNHLSSQMNLLSARGPVKRHFRFRCTLLRCIFISHIAYSKICSSCEWCWIRQLCGIARTLVASDIERNDFVSLLLLFAVCCFNSLSSSDKFVRARKFDGLFALEYRVRHTKFILRLEHTLVSYDRYSRERKDQRWRKQSVFVWWSIFCRSLSFCLLIFKFNSH